MIAILIGAGVSGVVLGAASRMIFLLPAALMALVVAAVLIVRADIDLGFTALAATLLNGGFLLGLALAPAMPRLLASPPWTVDETDAGFMVRDHNREALACAVSSERRQTACSPATRHGGLPATSPSCRSCCARGQLSHARCKNLGGFRAVENARCCVGTE
jgi:hypothetical protein